MFMFVLYMIMNNDYMNADVILMTSLIMLSCCIVAFMAYYDLLLYGGLMASVHHMMLA